MVKPVLCLFACTALVFAAPAIASVEATSPIIQPGETILIVEAKGEVSVAPDRMGIRTGVVSVAADAKTAVAENNRKMAKIVSLLKEKSFSVEQLKTSDFSLSPKFRDGGRGRDRDETEIIGFVVENELEITFKDLANAGTIISELFSVGANSASGPHFWVKDSEKIGWEAERLALANAVAKAERRAATLKMRIARILRVSDTQIDIPDGNDYIIVTGSRIAPTPIEPGEVVYTAEIHVEFALVPK